MKGTKRKEVLIYLGHPAHFHLFRIAIDTLGTEKVLVCIKSKDVLEKLLNEHNIPFINIGKRSGKLLPGKAGLILNILLRIFSLLKLCFRYRPRRLAGSAAELAITGRLTGIPGFIFFEDDFEYVKPFARIAGPLADYLICPDVCSAWKWENRKIAYSSYHELAYLHPNHFTPDPERIKGIFREGEKNFILRFSSLGAYHDEGKTGITDELACELIRILEPHGRVFITSERELPAKLEPYRIRIPARDIHHALYYANLYIGDSQTMTAEAAVLGTPSIRFNDFAGKLGYLEDLEHRYKLTVGISANDPQRLMATVNDWLQSGLEKEDWQERRRRMLREKADFSKCMNHIFECDPGDRRGISKIAETNLFH